MANYTTAQLDEKQCPTAGVMVTRGATTSPEKQFVYVDSVPTANFTCDRITRFILGPSRQAVLDFRKKVGSPKDKGGALATCETGVGDVLTIDTAGQVVEALTGQDLLVPESTTVEIDGATVPTPKRIATAQSEKDFTDDDKKRRTKFLKDCSESES